jgi:hypothetical protein
MAVAASRARAGGVLASLTASVPGLESHCRALLTRAGLLDCDRRTFALVGSALRSAWTGEPWREVDVVMLDGHPAPRAARGRPGVVVMEWTGGPEALVAAADFTVCQVAVHEGRLLHGPRFLEDVARRVLVANRVDGAAALPALLRTYKFAARGYGVPLAELHRVLDAVRRAPPAALSPEAVLRHGGGVVLP